MEFLYKDQLASIKKNLQAHNEKVNFKAAAEVDVFYLKSCKVPESVINFYEHAEPDDVVEISDSRIWPISVLKLENEKMEPGSIVFPLGYFVVGTTVFGDCYCLDMKKISKKNPEPEIVLVSHDRTHFNNAVNDILDNIVVAAKDFSEFLALFARGKLKS
jgi:hypothetical protein